MMYYSQESISLLSDSKQLADSYHHNIVDSMHFLYQIAKNKDQLSLILQKHEISLVFVDNYLTNSGTRYKTSGKNFRSAGLHQSLYLAREYAKYFKAKYIEPKHILHGIVNATGLYYIDALSTCTHIELLQKDVLNHLGLIKNQVTIE